MTTDIFADTLAEMTWYEVDQAAKDGAVLLWAFGVIEQHGPHLPTGTDVYLPQARLRDVKRELKDRGVQALIVPPYYWGVNVVSGSFPASYRVRPEVIRELMADVFQSFEGDGFKQVFCFSGHGDALHNRTIHDGIKLGTERTKLDLSFVMDAALAKRLGIALDDANITVPDGPLNEGLKFFQINASSPSSPQSDDTAPRYVDVHAGRWESSMMLASCASLVRDDVRKTLKSTDLGPDDLAVWRKGYLEARKTTPLGYFGDPAAASLEEGVRNMKSSAEIAADAIVKRIRAKEKA